MHAADYDAFTRRLLDQVSADGRTLGLVAAGSMADLSRRDEWSDHDFLLIVQSGTQEDYRQQLTWLPDADQIVMRLRETEHGLKVLYASGHLLEFAVFDLDELMMAKANDYRVLLDRADIAARMARIAQASIPAPLDPHNALENVLGLLQVGTGRYARGERMSGHIFVKSYALGHLLRLIAHVVPAEQPENVHRLDNLDIFRRFEQVYPRISADAADMLLQPVPDCAVGMLDLIAGEVQPRLPDFPEGALEAVRQHVARVRGS